MPPSWAQEYVDAELATRTGPHEARQRARVRLRRLREDIARQAREDAELARWLLRSR